ncbi:succinyldiaminopimelate transaminase [Halioglobus japonicus]|uniref:Succinyldiaminopimelate transaminase n=1 Tax=Halioglobus japonicus TaxID=930805 RepID=A0AAP8ME72_9GAMM|nr:succinyldiaminopimelate transaminase [Halioglobus japonicus]AQA17886.1 succinyldiaminopimelate transaminase [Halioglobus japonicus]PLW85849.1 succinyldiaminopimelate transaminase [Halioglobus japonicus]GHD17816.1 succinyldiaminopimelate transaminase [Halioglobus japonicus]
MNPDLQRLQPYPFEKLRALFADLEAPADTNPIALSIGEPKHPSPAFVLQAVADNLDKLASYPLTRGSDALREAIGDWLQRRFKLQGIDAERHILPVNGTREALFAFAQTIVDRDKAPLVLSPNPFYQIYEGAALLAGATPVFLDCGPDTGYLPDFAAVTEDQWQQCQLLYICSPGNPTGAVMSLTQLQDLIKLASEHDFVIASDECYSEIYGDESNPPAGLLQACAAMGDGSYRNCVVFHSLSKRSNLPGLRSGFVAGDADIIGKFLQYRTYHGCAMPAHHQIASIAAWNDEQHVIENRARYRAKFDAVLDILGDKLNVTRPDAGFYLWPETPIGETEFARGLFAQQHVTVLPGSFLAREVDGHNPGANRIRMALVAEMAQCVEAAERIAAYLETL